MKKKSNYRTPKRLLSLFLCVLMVATSVVFANPFTAEAGYGKNYSQIGRWSQNENSASLGFHVYNVSGADFTSNSSLALSSLTGEHSYIIYQYYDFRDGAKNYNPSINFVDYYYDISTQHNWSSTLVGNPIKSGSITTPASVPAYANSSQGTSAISSMSFSATYRRIIGDNKTMTTAPLGYTPNPSYSITITLLYYGINTTRLYEEFDNSLFLFVL